MFVLLYAVVSLLPLPKTVFTLAGGALFGLPAGLPVVVAGAMLGAVAAFLLGRFLGHDTLRWLTGGRSDALEARMADHGVWTVLVAPADSGGAVHCGQLSGRRYEASPT